MAASKDQMKILLLGCVAIYCYSIIAGGDKIGVNNGMVGDNLPPADQVVALMKQNNIGKYRIFQGSPEVLPAFANSGIDVIVGIETNRLQEMSSSQDAADSWVKTNIVPFYPATNIKYIAVGNEVVKVKENVSYLLPAMKNIQTALQNANLQNKIKVSTTHASESVIGNALIPPSKGVFLDDVKDTMSSVLKFLSDNEAPFMANVYPFFSYVNENWRNISLEYALFKSTSPVMQDGDHSYTNLFDAIVDTIISAMENLGYQDFPLIITESGWPSAGLNVATVDNAQAYNNNLIKHVLSNAGTPKRPGRSIETYIFADIDVFMKATAIEGQETSVMTDYVLKILGLDICADTMVGDSMRRGISGGQKKRVTTGEMMVGGAKVFLMDEISTGLDSSTTYQIVRCFSQFVHIMRETMVISLLQPAPETYDLFDDVILLSEGYIVYQGPREFVLEFFESMGFKCPDRKGVADFLQEVTSRKDQEQYWSRTQAYHYVSVKDFAHAFQSFHVGANLNAELSVPYNKSDCHPAALSTEKYGLSRSELFKACFDRQVLLMKRNAFVHIFKFCQITAVALLAMSIYFRTNMHHRNLNDGSIYFGALFLGLVMNMFNGIAGMAMTIAKLPVFYKQRDFMFYPAWAYSLPIWISEVPSSLIESAVWVALTYYTVNFAPNPNRFFRQFVLYVALHQTGLGLFRFIAALARNLIVANSVGVFALLLTFVFGGYIISREDIKGWWIWAYWSSPLSYAQNAVSVNEFLATRWQQPNNHIGMQLLHSRGLFTNNYWYWIGTAALIGFVVMFNIIFTLALDYLDPIGSAQAIVIEDELEKDEREMQNLPGRRSISLSTERPHENQSSGPTVKSRGMILPFQPLSLAFHNVNYYVDMPAEMKKQGVTEQRLQLLRDVSGSFRPGILTALVGESGAGKTTLMDVLAGRKTGGYIEGSITISGYPKKQETFARISGYCEQTDIHSPYVTVHESLVYSAWLRLGEEVDSDTRKMFVNEVMELVEMKNLSGALVGFPGVNGLSTEQRKRLTIAVELVANPSIIFMDEPTSGLDARAAAIVMRTVRNTVDTGRTVVCTIHQPSIDIFEAFDELVLMKRGGQMIYVGPLGHQSQALVDYLEGIEGVPKITPGYNPATWMLEVTSVTSAIRLGVDFAEIYKNSSLYQRNEALIQEISKPVPGTNDLSFERQFAQPFAVQTMACLWKQHWSYWRNPQYNSVRFFFTLACGLLFGTAFWRMGRKTHRQQDILNAMGSMFAAILFLGFSNVVSVLPVVDVERTVFYREKAAGMYSALPYALAQLLIEVPYVFVQAVVYGLLVYALIDFRWTAAKFFWYFFMMFFTLLYTTYYGMLTVGLTPNSSIASVLSTGFIAIWMVFCGFLIPRPRIPVWWRWYYWVSPFAWTLYGLIASQFGDNSDEMVMNDGTKQQVNKFLRSYFGYRHDFMGPVAVATMSFAVLFGLIFAISIKILNFQTR